MAVLVKDPDAVLDYSVDWASDYLIDGETVTASEWLAEPAGELTLTNAVHDAGAATVRVGGGVANHVYRLTNRIASSLGRSDDRSITLRCIER